MEIPKQTTILDGSTGTIVLLEVAKQVSNRWQGSCLTWDGNVPPFLETMCVQYKERMTVWQREMRNLVQDALDPHLGEPTGFTSNAETNVSQFHLGVSSNAFQVLIVDVIQSEPRPTSSTNNTWTETKHDAVVHVYNAAVTSGVGVVDTTRLNPDLNLGQVTRNISTATVPAPQRNANFNQRHTQRHALFETPGDTLARLGPRLFFICILTQLVILAVIGLYSKIMS